MTAQPAQRSDLGSLESLDWDFAPSCEHHEHSRKPRLHSGPAYALVRATCPECGWGATRYLCQKFLAGVAPINTRCTSCLAKADRSWYHIIALVRP